ncbi:MAG: 6-carboxytetrahydropterin synthase QueD [Deltaproteobacteria bacterium]|nr:6-carboxytetrahydropterin synthase QueD [Deltaproteobacteria bacterium]
MHTRVTKIIKFETAHQLTDSYSKECQTMHGHSYKCEVTFENDVDPETGMIMDFKKIKEILKPVVDKYDHQAFTKDTFNCQNPTAENMARDIFNMVDFATPPGLVKRVRLWETDTCYAEVSY